MVKNFFTVKKIKSNFYQVQSAYNPLEPYEAINEIPIKRKVHYIDDACQFR